MITLELIQTTSSLVDVTTAPIFLGDLKDCAISVTISDTVTGSINLQQSVDGTNWIASGSPVAITAAGTTIISASYSVPYIRIFWDYTSGATPSNIIATATIKQIYGL